MGGKTYMARDGVFNEADVMLAWHLGDESMADNVTSQAMVDAMVEFMVRLRMRRLIPGMGAVRSTAHWPLPRASR